MRILEVTWESNTILQWGIAAIILLALPMIARVVGHVLGGPAKRADAAGSRQLLPQLAEAVRRPAGILVWVAGLWVIRYEVLTLPEWLRPWADRALYIGLAFG